MLRRQYKYLISPNGNRHSALIAPHIICGAVSAVDIPFDPSSVSPSPLPLAHVFLLFMQFILGLYLHPLSTPLRLPVNSLCSCCHLSLSASPLLFAAYVCLLCCVLSSGALLADVSLYDGAEGK